MHEFFAIKGDVHAALCDSVDTRTVVEKIRELIALGNAYIIEKVGLGQGDHLKQVSSRLS